MSFYKNNTFLLILFFLTVSGCSNQEDTSPRTVSANSISQTYYEYAGNDSWVQEMVSVIRQKEYGNKLAEVLYEKYGEAHWELAAKGPAWNQRSGSESAGDSENEGDNNSFQEILVPMAHPDKERVNGVIGWRRLNDGTDVIRIFDRTVYEGLTKDQKMEQQPRLIAGYLLAFEHQLYETESLKFGDYTYRFEELNAFTNPSDFGWSCTVVKAYDPYTGELVGEWWYNCEDYTVTIYADIPSIEPEVTSDPYTPTYYDPNYSQNPYYSITGGGSTTDYSYDPATLTGENPLVGGANLDLSAIYNTIEGGPAAPTKTAIENYMQLIAGELSKYPDTQEIGESIFEASQDDNLTVPEKLNLALRAREIYLTAHLGNFDIDILSGAQHTRLAKDAGFIEFYPKVKNQIQDNGWPLSGDEWSALWEIFKPLMAEVLFEAIPGGGITLAFRDLVEGVRGSDIALVTAGIVSLAVEFYPPGKIFKSIRKIGKVLIKGFKFVKLARKHLRMIANALELGVDASINGSIIRLEKNGSKIGEIRNKQVVPDKYKTTGNPVGDPKDGYTLVDDGGDIGFRRTPDVSGYSSSDLRKLTEHPRAHVLERHGHDVSDEALIKRANTGIAPDGSPFGVQNPTPPPYSSKFNSPQALMNGYNLTKPGSPDFIATQATHNGTRKRVIIPPGNVKYGVGVARGGNTLEDMTGIVASYEKVGGVWKLVTMFPNK